MMFYINSLIFFGCYQSANEVCEGYVFTRVCHSVHGGRWCPGPGLGGVQVHAQGRMSRPRGEVSRDRLGCVQSQARGVQAQAGVCPGTGLGVNSMAHEMVVCHFLGGLNKHIIDFIDHCSGRCASY